MREYLLSAVAVMALMASCAAAHDTPVALIDGLGDLHGTLKARFGEKLKLPQIGAARPWWRRRLNVRSPLRNSGRMVIRLLGKSQKFPRLTVGPTLSGWRAWSVSTFWMGRLAH